MENSSSTSKSVSFEVTVSLKELKKEQEWPKTAAYVFSRSGTFLGKQPLTQDVKNPTIGRAEFKIRTDVKDVIVKVGPDIEKIWMLDRYQPIVSSAKVVDKMQMEFDLAEKLWGCWFKVAYHVIGSVKKQTGSSSGPVCAGEVSIYDVDITSCLLILPDSIIEQIRNGIIDIVVNPPPAALSPVEFTKPVSWWEWEEDEYCGTKPVPGPLPRADIIKKLEDLPPEWTFAKERFEELPIARERMDAVLQGMTLVEKQAFLNTEVVEGVRISQILYSNTTQFRGLVTEQFEKLRFWLCWWPWIYWIWWPYCGYTLEKLGTAELQFDGSFSKTVYLSVCRHDTPDLWFVVRQNINGIDRVIYARHPVPCNTLWNHPSGKLVQLIVTDPAAIACAQQRPGISDRYVMPIGVYEDEWHEIDQAHIKSFCDSSKDLPSACGLYKKTDPYGTRLDFRMQFHEDLRNPAPSNTGVQYYRWSYRRHGDYEWTYLDETVVHRYITKVAQGWAIEPDTLGPHTVNDTHSLFHVPDPDRGWLQNRDDLAFAIWHTDRVPNGKYDLRLEMFDKNGNKVEPTTAGFTYVLPTASIGILDDKLFVEDGGLILHLHIDNRCTVSEIRSVALNGVKAEECQFLEYEDKNKDMVNVEYVAYHPATPHNFMERYDLTISRGISGIPKGSAALILDTTKPVRTSQTLDFAVKDLLDSYGRCSFSVYLHTYPLTRNGQSRIRDYESSDTSNFALVEKGTIQLTTKLIEPLAESIIQSLDEKVTELLAEKTT
jgi:hypothetical protein